MNKPAPNFRLQNQDGIVRSLSDYKGRWLVLYFYPKDNSSNCTKEACSFRDEKAAIAQFGNAVVVGINKESVASHKKFSDKNHLNFDLLSDPDHSVTKAYGAWKTGGGNLIDRVYSTRRNTYIIDPKGMIVKECIGITPNEHTTQIIEVLQSYQAKK